MSCVSLRYIPQSRFAPECLKLSHTIIRWSFEFLDVVMGEVLPQRVLSSRHLTRMWNTAGRQNSAAADLLLLKSFSIVLPVERWRYRSLPISSFCAIPLFIVERDEIISK